jgi:hypothetical protein
MTLAELLDDIDDKVDEVDDELGTPPPDPVPTTSKALVEDRTEKIRGDCAEILEQHVSPPGAGIMPSYTAPTTITGCIADMRTANNACREATTDATRGGQTKLQRALCLDLQQLCGI